MSSLYQPPLIPGLSASGVNPLNGNYAASPNPFFTIANQFLPRNLHDVIRWARYITLQSPVTTEVVRKLATYPITDFVIETNDERAKERYKQIFKTTKLKSALHDIGFDYYTIGNVFLSVYFPIHRTLSCPKCGTSFSAKKANFLNFRNWDFHGQCPNCLFLGNFIRKDTKSLDIKEVNLVKWDPVNIAVNHNPITNEYEYFYRIPNEVKRRVRQGDKLFVNSVPWGFIEAIKNNQDFKFDADNVFHLKNVSAGPMVEGVAIPPLISLFSLVFYQQMLRRGNEAIAQDYLAPMRVVFPQPQTANSDPVIAMSLRNFVSRMEQSFVKHKTDPNHVLIAPAPIGYQAITGEGKALLVSQEIAQAEESILLSLGVSRELLSGQTNWTSSTVGLRMLRNTLEVYVDQIETFLEWFGRRTGSYFSLDEAEIKLTPFKLTDDEGLRSMLESLVQGGGASMTTLYESYGKDYKEELDRIKNDAVAKARYDVETAVAVEEAQFLAARKVAAKLNNEGSGDYKSVLDQAQQLAEQLVNADPAVIRQTLHELKMSDYSMYLMTAKLLDEIKTQTHETDMQDAMVQNTAQGGQTPGNDSPTDQASPNASQDQPEQK